MHEGELIRRAQAGDRQAFGVLVQQHQARVFSFIRRLCGNPHNAQDMTQDTFIKAWHALPDWRPEARLETWLLRIARNTTIDALRRNKHMPEPLPEDYMLTDSGPSPLRQLESSRSLHALEQLVAQLPVGQREVLLLREMEGLSYQDIASTLDISEGTVKSRLARAREALLTARRAITGDSDD
ncbi:RNA polymerase sigma factor AlgU [Pseudomonas saudimassiliensis]|uniref:RNA polymerase sigma factor AlgU n=1 Tax=Pseudomonas saudimassiliensis TaxID=1461581 RepID=A0A078MIS9_9PSED|nr:sigma-70 family RNA polymerase sigma factor [Pseudomonas saudimassiliensis]CEA06155.1 RNA polymerase sigma factor AlgU [Pseudomonas saudimassiliensis]CEF27580.1 RNA polymerase sigma factor AlgU [Pseudomonas saudimassiliensis]